MNNLIDMNYLLEVAGEAGSEILMIYESDDFSIELKADDSPLTKADRISHKVISDALKERYPDIPVISEEGKNIPFDRRRDWHRFWLIDPLDGTKEFIKKNGEFTVNIALIEGNYPTAGLIYAPVLDEFYFAHKDYGAFKIINGVKSDIFSEKITSSEIIAVKSRSHSSPEEEEVLSKYQVTRSISVGSSLKFCMIAAGRAQVYFRKNPTWEWDTAAGQAIVEVSGGSVRSGGRRLAYNKPTLLNSSFLATSIVRF